MGAVGGKLAGEGQPHGSAAHDAVLTAEVFLIELSLWMRERSRLKRKQAPTSPGETMGEPLDGCPGRGLKCTPAEDLDAVDGLVGEGPPLAAGFLVAHPVCRNFCNHIAIVGAKPGT